MEDYIKKEVKSIKIIYRASFMFVFFVLFLSVIYNINVGPVIFSEVWEGIMISSSAIFSFIFIMLGSFIYLNIMKRNTKVDLELKIKKYRKAFILRTIFIELVAMFIIVCYFFFGSAVFLISSILALALLGFFYPTKARVNKELKLKN